MSGTPTCDDLQHQENGLNTHRLFSLHGPYLPNVLEWTRMTIKRADEDPTYKYPRCIMLDSGAFTAWNLGHETRLDDVRRAYDAFHETAGGLGKYFDEIWMVNLDVIPGQKGVDPSPDEIASAIRQSDINFKILDDHYPGRILPVFHQGEDDARLVAVGEMNERERYICVSPRNDVMESWRVRWSETCHLDLREKFGAGVIRTHGLATTGNDMIRKVPWYSGDSAAWVHHARFGMIDIFEEARGRYANYFVTRGFGKDERDKKHIGTEENMKMMPARRAAIMRIIEKYGFTLEQIADVNDIAMEAEEDGTLTQKVITSDDLTRKGSFRRRALICMGEMDAYAKYASKLRDAGPVSAQQLLFGEL